MGSPIAKEFFESMRMVVIPAIDILNSKVVRLQEGDFERMTSFSSNPLATAKEFEAYGLTHVHVVDLEGAKAGHVVHWKELQQISDKTRLKVDFGGGLRRLNDILRALEIGVRQVNIGSLALTDRDLLREIVEEAGASKVNVGVDVRDGEVHTHGWQLSSNKKIDEVIDFCSSLGITSFTCTDIRRDGMMQGPSFHLYKSILTDFPGIDLIASGGIFSVEDLGRLEDMGCRGAIVGQALYSGQLPLEVLSQMGKW